MASACKSSFSTALFLFLTLLLAFNFSTAFEAQTDVPVVEGLSWTFYNSNCPNLKNIVRTRLQKVFQRDIGQAAGILRLLFHDCFVQGCDGSVLLDGTSAGSGEKKVPPNLTLRPQAFKIINDLQALIHKQCGRVVSCADIIALAARDAVYLSGGPDFELPLGRRDSLNFATDQATVSQLPVPTSSAAELLSSFGARKLDATDLVALSGGHTIGISYCFFFTDRLFPNQDSTMENGFAQSLKITCPKSDTDNTTFLDFRTPNTFDNKYYVDLVNRQGLFTSDQDLFVDRRTRDIVTSFAKNQSLFFDKFVRAMIKLSQVDVLTGTQGEIRANCSARNPPKLMTVVEEALEEMPQL